MIGYKGFDSELKCRGFQYEIGETYRLEGELAVCHNGFHFCENLMDCFVYYPAFESQCEPNWDSRFCIVEALGSILRCNNKYATDKIKIVRELSRDEIIQLTNFGTNCNGYGNVGSGNNGIYNTGVHNKGSGNTGNRNYGDGNVGCNNFGNGNAGDCNTGNYNTGDFNVTDNSTGCFNTKPQEIYMFNKPTAMSLDEWRGSYVYRLLSYGYSNIRSEDKRLRQEWWDDLNPYEKDAVMHLPNFDAKIFYECTGIDVHHKKNATIFDYYIPDNVIEKLIGVENDTQTQEEHK